VRRDGGRRNRIPLHLCLDLKIPRTSAGCGPTAQATTFHVSCGYHTARVSPHKSACGSRFAQKCQHLWTCAERRSWHVRKRASSVARTRTWPRPELDELLLAAHDHHFHGTGRSPQGSLVVVWRYDSRWRPIPHHSWPSAEIRQPMAPDPLHSWPCAGRRRPTAPAGLATSLTHCGHMRRQSRGSRGHK
jgi:hypothetical protein